MTTAPTPTQFDQFTYGPGTPTPPPEPTPEPASSLGLLAGLEGFWTGEGFNAIWRPSHSSQDRFLELNRTTETLQFTGEGLGTIPNRGFLQDDLFMGGLRYLQKISDANTGEGLHIEPGLWLSIPATSAPNVVPSVARLASIPHGTAIVAQGTAFEVPKPKFEAVDLNPFSVGSTHGDKAFPEQDLSKPTDFRTPDKDLAGIDQALVNNPNSFLENTASPNIASTVVLDVTTSNTPILGGGTANTAFLEGAPTAGPNADAALVTAIFWLETLSDGTEQLQYTQTVLLNFNGLSWPHITVATLKKTPVSPPGN